MRLVNKRIAQITLGTALFVSGVAAGTLHARSAAVQNHFGQPKTVLHVVVYRFREDVSNYDREKAINGIKDMAGKIPGIKNMQPGPRFQRRLCHRVCERGGRRRLCGKPCA